LSPQCGEVLNPRAWRALPIGWRHAIGDAIAQRRAPLPLAPTNGNLGLPADLLIMGDGRVAAVKYGIHAYDQWSVDQLVDLAPSSDGVQAGGDTAVELLETGRFGR
jgi:hypothetical protein